MRKHDIPVDMDQDMTDLPAGSLGGYRAVHRGSLIQFEFLVDRRVRERGQLVEPGFWQSEWGLWVPSDGGDNTQQLWDILAVDAALKAHLRSKPISEWRAERTRRFPAELSKVPHNARERSHSIVAWVDQNGDVSNTIVEIGSSGVIPTAFAKNHDDQRSYTSRIFLDIAVYMASLN